LKNIQKLGRPYEKSITIDYLSKIQDSYFSFFRQNPDNKYLVADINNIDFINNEAHYKKIIDAIFFNEYPVGFNRLIL
jgi:deoxyadenosine/deoxycytidine kinase